MTPEARARRRVLWMNLCFSAGLAFALPWFAASIPSNPNQKVRTA